MDKSEFLNILERGLSPLPKSERENIMNYYTELFFEAGEENYEAVAARLGSPHLIAKKLLAENGFSADDGAKTDAAPNSYQPPKQKRKKRNPIVWMFAIFFLFPVWSALVGFLFTIFMFMLSMCVMFFCCFIAGAASVAGGAVVLAYGVFAVITMNVFAALYIISFGCFFTGAGLIIAYIFFNVSAAVCKYTLKAAKKLCRFAARKVSGIFSPDGAFA